MGGLAPHVDSHFQVAFVHTDDLQLGRLTDDAVRWKVPSVVPLLTEFLRADGSDFLIVGKQTNEWPLHGI